MPKTVVKQAHTPGPWEYVLDDDGQSSGVTFVIRMDSNLGGCNGWEPQHRIEYAAPAREESPKQFAEAEANAQLIAAVPDLLAALKALAEVYHDLIDADLIDDTEQVELRAAQAALSKAEPQS